MGGEHAGTHRHRLGDIQTVLSGLRPEQAEISIFDTTLIPAVILQTLPMRSQTDMPAERGVSGRLSWLVGGALGGLIGAILFGGVLWTVEPALVTESIPQIYGLEGGGPAGWAFHLAHGAVLGIIFGLLVTRNPILGTLTADVATPFLDKMTPGMRIIAAGLVYGLAIWVFLPGIILSILVTFGDIPDPLPWASVYSLIGHLLYGMLLGALVSVFIDIEVEATDTEAPFEEEGTHEGSSTDRQERKQQQ